MRPYFCNERMEDFGKLAPKLYVGWVFLLVTWDGDEASHKKTPTDGEHPRIVQTVRFVFGVLTAFKDW